MSTGPSPTGRSADVIVVGAGPAGSTAAFYLAAAGLDVLVLEKTRFPREKVCGDGFTPRAVREIQRLGLPHGQEQGWRRNVGLKLVAAGRSIELPWPELTDFPSYGLVRTRLGFDEQLARHAQSAGASILEGVSVHRADTDDAGVVTGVSGHLLDERGRKTGEEASFTAPLVLAADGNSTRTAVSLGQEKRDDRPLGVAVRTYFTTPRHEDPWMEGWLELPGPRGLLPGYGWIFGMGDGTANVGLGILNSSKEFGRLDYRQVLRDWTSQLPPEWGFTPEAQVGKVLGAALPMGFNRTPHYRPGLMLLGDAGGMVSPFNGEGISYAMESARIAAEQVVQAHGEPLRREEHLARYPRRTQDEWGSHFTQGRLFAQLIGHPRFMWLAVRAGMPVPMLMRFVVRLMANLTDRPGHDVVDRAVALLEKLTPPTRNQQPNRTAVPKPAPDAEPSPISGKAGL